MAIFTIQSADLRENPVALREYLFEPFLDEAKELSKPVGLKARHFCGLRKKHVPAFSLG
jgi:hypothetical protein